MPKSHGELGFKDLSLFNQAFLAKQGWRVLSDPSSIVFRLLKAKYFNNVDFLRASLSSGCSHIWRSFMWGRSLLLKGLRWKVGDGSSIRIFKDQWIPRPSTFKPITPNPGSDSLVSALIDVDPPEWKLDLINQTFLPADKEIIISIPLSFSGGPDSLTWHFEKSGVFSVKSGYKLALSEKLSASVSNSSNIRKWWSSVWNLNLPPKVRIFVWRACLNAIPSGFNLWKRKIMDRPLCLWCKTMVNTASHSLFWCSQARKVWGCTRFDSFFDFPSVSIRNDKGKVLAALSRPLTGLFSFDIGGFLAFREGLLLAKLHNFNVHIAEVAPSTASPLVSLDSALGGASFIVSDIRTLLAEVGVCKCQSITPSGNTLALKLAAMAFSSVRESLWLDFSSSL
ncbi:hypothetical protein Dsin_016746 [Dipteronia sinensis]|uniref:Reverse transcriptase zinc-binding domain-containing protein n=1 Tax=Dipteronia sinensis TaxID=43782 RepID=A0AAE0ADP6_9ROSI|nr:hypothetical protein Dsin_016746 [Dipteronia sinensis]